MNVTATGDITADGEQSAGFPSGITSLVIPNAVGDAGGITISTNNLNLTNGGQIDASTGGQGNAGAVNVTATGDITTDGENSGGIPSGIISQVNPDAVGDAGGVTISTNNLNLTNGGRVDSTTFGQGNAGAVNVAATGDITADGEQSAGIPSGIISQVNPDAVGDAGGVTISTNNLNLTNGGQVSSGTLGQGNAGVVNVTAAGDITVDGENSGGIPRNITNGVALDAVGDAGEITISTNNLNLTNGARIDSSTFSQGNAGAINIIASGDITAVGENSGGSPSGITSQVATEAEGDAGGITISTNNLNLTNGGLVDSTTLGQGNANNITIESVESITINGFIERFRSGISANALNEDGNGGNVTISTGKLSIANGGTIEATNFEDTGLEASPGRGRPGNISIAADTIGLTDNARIETATQFTGEESGIINLQVVEDIILENNSFISAQAFGEANGGNLNIDSRFIIAFPNGSNDILASAENGAGGNININAESLLGIQERPMTSDRTNDINASSEVSGLDGTINISTPDINPVQGATELPNNVVEPEETTQQACEANRESAAKNGLNISGKGGIVPEPGLPLNSLNVTVDGETNPTSTIPMPIETAQGKIQPARGVVVTQSGEVILTAYRTNNSEDRIPEGSVNCGRV